VTALHLPSAPTTSHASHCTLHAESQHNPSTHVPLAHSVSAAHFCPFFFTHVPGALVDESPQNDPVAQLSTVQQTILSVVSLTAQWPLLHWEGSVHTVPSEPVVVHTPLLHTYPVAQSLAVLHESLHDELEPHA